MYVTLNTINSVVGLEINSGCWPLRPRSLYWTLDKGRSHANPQPLLVQPKHNIRVGSNNVEAQQRKSPQIGCPCI